MLWLFWRCWYCCCVYVACTRQFRCADWLLWQRVIFEMEPKYLPQPCAQNNIYTALVRLRKESEKKNKYMFMLFKRARTARAAQRPNECLPRLPRSLHKPIHLWMPHKNTITINTETHFQKTTANPQLCAALAQALSQLLYANARHNATNARTRTLMMRQRVVFCWSPLLAARCARTFRKYLISCRRHQNELHASWALAAAKRNVSEEQCDIYYI